MATSPEPEDKRSGCPIRPNSSNAEPTYLSKMWSSVAAWTPFRERTQNQEERQALESRGPGNREGCPVNDSSQQLGGIHKYNSQYNPLTSELVYGQERAPGQRTKLSTVRERSTIAKGDFSPPHQPEGSTTWVYPSEQQYFNAIKRKGHKANEEDMPNVLAIHNAVNEQGWAMVRDWENLHSPGAEPKLLRFCGRPNDTSPKAWFKTNIMGYKPPFDRHDWVVERDGKEVRYVIDFYAGASTPEKPVALHLDVRPALDSFEACVDRAHMVYQQTIEPVVQKIGGGFVSGDKGTSHESEDAPLRPPPPGGIGR
ncbi:unnamed protein product [Choristocarpus tenellus]